MLTYNDLIALGENETNRMDFVRQAITEHENSRAFKDAKISNDYLSKCNTTITNYQKTLVTKTGRVVPDKWSPNHKAASAFFNRFVTQEAQYLLGNGVTWGNKATASKVGVSFDVKLQQLATMAITNGVAYGFWDKDELNVFTLAGTPQDPTYFRPFFDENNGSLRAGIRYWRIDTSKPLRATLYEEDGFTEYAWRLKDEKGNTKEIGEIIQPKRPYKLNVEKAPADAEATIYSGENYPTLPIIPIYGNFLHQSELVGIREKIDAYDLLQNGYVNELDTAQIYWIIKNAGGADNEELAMFLDQLRSLHAANTGDGTEIQPVTVDVPYNAREAALNRLERQLYKDYGALDTDAISNGAATATQIKAAYEPMETKSCELESCVLDFLYKMLPVIGVADEKPSFTRTRIVNTSEEVQNVVMAAQYTGAEYATRKILTLLGDGDKADKIIREMDADEIERFSEVDNGYSTQPNGQPVERTGNPDRAGV